MSEIEPKLIQAGMAADDRGFIQFVNTMPEDVKRFYIGHYSPKGNHFLAFEIKNDLVNWLDPKPITYLEGGTSNTELVGKLAKTIAGKKLKGFQ